jgi:hypothetical protein
MLLDTIRAHNQQSACVVQAVATAPFACPAGQELIAAAATTEGGDEATCCEAIKCDVFTRCHEQVSGMQLIGAAATTAGTDAVTCCEAIMCDAFSSCPAGKELIAAAATTAGIHEATCCYHVGGGTGVDMEQTCKLDYDCSGALRAICLIL